MERKSDDEESAGGRIHFSSSWAGARGAGVNGKTRQRLADGAQDSERKQALRAAALIRRRDESVPLTPGLRHGESRFEAPTAPWNQNRQI